MEWPEQARDPGDLLPQINSTLNSRGDEVQRSLDLLDRVLSEFDDLENANVCGGGGGGVAAVSSLGHSSEDDGYMSMNGRRHLPPPPEEAQRIISTLLPRVSPGNSRERCSNSRKGRLHTSMTLGYENRPDRSSSAATQTTIPKTRHQRPFGWQKNGESSRRLPPRTLPTAMERHREVKREELSVGLRPVAELSDANFSDDSLEGVPPPPPPPPVPPASKRASIAWEVPLDDDDALYTPGSTKVIGRRRRRSTDRSSTSSTSRLRDQDEWPDPPTGTEDGSISPLSDSSHLDSSTASKHDEALAELSGTDLSSGGTYVIRKGKRRERKPMPLPHEKHPPVNGELKRASSTFDNIKSLLKEGLIEGLDEAPPDFPPPEPPTMVRVVSMPTVTSEEKQTKMEMRLKEDSQTQTKLSELDTTLEEEDEKPPQKQDIGIQVAVEIEKKPEERDTSTKTVTINGISDSEGEDKRGLLLNGTDTSSNEALMIELRKEYDTESINNNNSKEHNIETAKEEVLEDPWLTATEISQIQVIPVVEDKETTQESDESDKPPQEFKVKVEVLQHEFGPLPPSPVEEDDEYADILRPSPAQTPRGKNEKKEPFYRCLEPPASDPLGTRFLNKAASDASQREGGTSSLKTRSMDAGFSRSHRIQQSSSRRDIPSERRTLPTELQGPSRRRTLQKRSGTTTREEGHMQVSCSLPETPIFARGCDIPRTPHRKAPEAPQPSRTTPRSVTTPSGYRSAGRGVSLGEAMAGAELLRLAGGPGRGWYPRHRAPRPASVEHLDRLPPGPWDPPRKPQTLPPNLTPKFFHRSPREALRRVTSLLIRKGNSKEKKDTLSPTSGLAGESSEGTRQKRGFFRSLWKRSRHYSLEQQ